MFSFRLPLMMSYFASGACFMSFRNLYESELYKYSFVMFGISVLAFLIAAAMTAKLEVNFYSKGYKQAMDDTTKWFPRDEES